MTTPLRPALALCALLLSAAVGCERKPEAVPPGAANAAGTGPGAALFQSRCATCHGPAGAGDGPVAGAIQIKMQNLGDPKWEAQVTDEYLEKIILGGGMSVGKSPAMPASADLARDPRLKDLIRHVRSLKDRTKGAPAGK